MEESITSALMSDSHEEIINQAMELHGQAVLELVYSYVQDRKIAEDLTQDIFIKIYQKLHQYNGKAKFKTWLWQIAINHCKDYLKSWYNRNVIISEEHSSTTASVKEAVENQVVEKDENEQLAQAVMNLPDFYREVIYLHYYEDLSIKEISYVTGSNQNSSTAALPFLCLFWAAYFAQDKPKLRVIVPIYLVTVYYYLALPSLVEAMVYSIVVLVMFIGSGIKRKTVYATASVAFGLLAIILPLFWFFSADYQKERIFAFLHPEADPQGDGFIYLKIKELLTTGGWLGTGSHSEYIGAPATELVLVNIAHYYGWIAAGLLVCVLMLLLLRMTIMLWQTKEDFGRQLLIGIISLFTIQILYNFSMVLGLLPITSLALPFVSYGFTSAVLNSFLFGIALSVCCRRHLISFSSR